MLKWITGLFFKTVASKVSEQLLRDRKSARKQALSIDSTPRSYKRRDNTKLTQAQLKHLHKKLTEDKISLSVLTAYANTKYKLDKGMSTYHRHLQQYKQSLTKES